MPTTGRPPKIFKVRRFMPKNRVQQERIKIPQPFYRPLRMNRRDVVQRGLLKQSPDWYVLHKRGVPGRKYVGVDPADELRAIPESMVTGNLPERIIYMELVKRGYVEGIDFSFQKSAEGGRNELGGIVADFVMEFHRIILQVDGPTHDTHIRKAKDREQESVLVSMGFSVLHLRTQVIDNPLMLEQWFRRHLDPGVVNILDPFDTFVDEVGGTG